MKILVADDNPSVRDTLDFLLDDWGYKTDLANNGLEAVEKAKRNQYDLYLMDIDMPGLDGIKTTLAIRRNFCDFYVPILAVTTHHNSKKKQCFAVGMDDFISKPFDIKELYKKINKLTVKTMVIKKEEDVVKITRENPMDKKDLEELKKLDEQGLTKLVLWGSGHVFIVNKKVQNKISRDFIGKKLELTEFVNQAPGDEGICHLYKNFVTSERKVLQVELKEALEKEKKDLEDCDIPVKKPLEEKAE